MTCASSFFSGKPSKGTPNSILRGPTLKKTSHPIACMCLSPPDKVKHVESSDKFNCFKANKELFVLYISASATKWLSWEH